LDALTKILNIENKVIFVGKKLNVKHFLSIADIFVLPTLNEGRKEGSPVALLEAMASGLPVIGTKIPGVKEQLQNFPDSLVEPGNVDALTSKIDFFLCSDIQWRKQYGERLRSEVAAFFDIETEIKRHEQMYLDVLKLRFD
jgi:glycosyltransferase involved in cell wall biosynthesis